MEINLFDKWDIKSYNSIIKHDLLSGAHIVALHKWH